MIATGRRAGGGVSTRRGWQGYARAQQLVFPFNPRRHRQSSRAAACTWHIFLSSTRGIPDGMPPPLVTRHLPKVFLAPACVIELPASAILLFKLIC